MAISSKNKQEERLNIKSFSQRDLHALEEQFKSLETSIKNIRKILSQPTSSDLTNSPLPGSGKDRIRDGAGTLTLSEDQADVHSALTALCRNVKAEDREDAIRHKLVDCFALDGWVAAGVLLGLLRQSGEYVTHMQLAEVAGTISPSAGVIRVYVCKLRQQLEARGIEGGAIETGRRSYRLVRSAAFKIINTLNQREKTPTRPDS